MYKYVRIDLDYDRWEEEGDHDHECSGSWCCRPNTYGQLNDVRVSIDESTYKGGPVPDFIVPGATVYVLIDDYSDGDTFGNDQNNYEAKGVFKTYDEAEAASNVLESNHGYFSGHNQWIIREVVVS